MRTRFRPVSLSGSFTLLFPLSLALGIRAALPCRVAPRRGLLYAAGAGLAEPRSVASCDAAPRPAAACWALPARARQRSLTVCAAPRCATPRRAAPPALSADLAGPRSRCAVWRRLAPRLVISFWRRRGRIWLTLCLCRPAPCRAVRCFSAQLPARWSPWLCRAAPRRGAGSSRAAPLPVPPALLPLPHLRSNGRHAPVPVSARRLRLKTIALKRRARRAGSLRRALRRRAAVSRGGALERTAFRAAEGAGADGRRALPGLGDGLSSRSIACYPATRASGRCAIGAPSGAALAFAGGAFSSLAISWPGPLRGQRPPGAGAALARPPRDAEPPVGFRSPPQRHRAGRQRWTASVGRGSASNRQGSRRVPRVRAAVN